MNVCCVCGNKIGILDDTRLLIKKEKDTIICDRCYNNICDLKSGNYENISSFEMAEEYFNECIDNKKVNGVKEKAIINYINEIVVNVKEQIDIEKIALGINKPEYIYHKEQEEFLLTTGYNFEGYKINDYINIVSGEAVLGTGFLSEFTAQVSDAFGTTNQSFKGKLSYAKQLAIKDMLANAKKMKANAIIGIDFDILNTINNMFIVSVNGTAVKIIKEQVTQEE